MATTLQNDEVSPDDSRAIWGGRVNETGYPYSGYIISYLNAFKANICGTVFLSQDVAISAAHCIDRQVNTVSVGYNEYTYDQSSNYDVKDIITLPEWDGEDNRFDMAIIKIAEPLTGVSVFGNVSTPTPGCNYEVLGYGNTENDSEFPMSERQRKSMEVCINRVDDRLIFMKGTGGGICFGDSGSPIFEKDTNRLVGVISGIIPTSSDEENYCHIDNKAVGVRLDVNLDFILPYISNTFADSSISICGETCESDDNCAEGLVCRNSLCSAEYSDSCVVEGGDFCSSQSNLTCKEGYNCILSYCNEDIEIQSSEDNDIFASLDSFVDFEEFFNNPSQLRLIAIIAAMTLGVTIGWLLTRKKTI